MTCSIKSIIFLSQLVCFTSDMAVRLKKYARVFIIPIQRRHHSLQLNASVSTAHRPLCTPKDASPSYCSSETSLLPRTIQAYVCQCDIRVQAVFGVVRETTAYMLPRTFVINWCICCIYPASHIVVSEL